MTSRSKTKSPSPLAANGGGIGPECLVVGVKDERQSLEGPANGAAQSVHGNGNEGSGPKGLSGERGPQERNDKFYGSVEGWPASKDPWHLSTTASWPVAPLL